MTDADCVRAISNTAISPHTRGPTPQKTFTYHQKHDALDVCFQECYRHYIVHDESSGRCYCWVESNCKPKGFCAEGGCPGSHIATWESEDGFTVYDQSACYRDDGGCDAATEVQGSSGEDGNEDSSDSVAATPPKEDSSDGSRGPRSPSDTCVDEIRNTAIVPAVRGPSAEQTFTYEMKFTTLEDCFRECPTHYIVHDTASEKCYCWAEQSCKPRGYCGGSLLGDCPGSPFGSWESEDGTTVYDQTACYHNDGCDAAPKVQDSSDEDGNEDSSDSLAGPPPPKGESNDGTGPWRNRASPSHACVDKIRNTAIVPGMRGPSPEQTYSYGKSFSRLEDCFRECSYDFIVHVESSGKCYCWQERECMPSGYCRRGYHQGGCQGQSDGFWESEDGTTVYDQTACYRDRGCDVPPEIQDSSDEDEDDKDRHSSEACNLTWDPPECTRSILDDPDEEKRYLKAPEGYGCSAANSRRVLRPGDTWYDGRYSEYRTLTTRVSFRYCMHTIAARSFGRDVVTYDEKSQECRIGCRVKDMECLPGVKMGKSCDEISW